MLFLAFLRILKPFVMGIEDQIRAIIQEEVNVLKQFISEVLSQQRNPEEQRYLTRKQVAEYLSIGLSTVDYWSKIGKLKRIHFKGNVRFDRQEIDQQMDSLKKYS